MNWRFCGAFLATFGCAPASFVGGHPSLPITASEHGIQASVDGIGAVAGSYVFALSLTPLGRARVVRAVLTHARSQLDDCDALTEACDELDARFTSGVTATVSGASRAPRVFLRFPARGTEQALSGLTHLLLDVELDGTHRLLDLDLSKEQAFRASDWGIGGAVRYRPPGFATQHFGHELSGELGIDRWFSSTRLRADYEIGFAGCRGTESERQHCQHHDGVLPFGFGVNATQYLRLDSNVTLGVGLGYEGVAVLGRFRSSSDQKLRADPFLHGPRVALSLTRSTPHVPRFAPAPPKTSLGLELSLELLGRGAFQEPVVIPALGYTYTFGF